MGTRGKKVKIDREELTKLYSKGVVWSELCRHFRCTPTTLNKHLKKLNLPPRKNPPRECICKTCGKHFTVTESQVRGRERGKYCCQKCYHQANRKWLKQKRKPKYEEFVKLCKSKGITCLSKKYVSARDKVHLRCDQCGRLWGAIPSNITGGHGCKICASKRGAEKRQLNDREIKRQIRQGGDKFVKWVSGEYQNIYSEIIIECGKCHKPWTTKVSNLRKNHRCPTCAKERAANSLRGSIEICQKLAQSRHGKFLSKKYENAHSNYEWQCAAEHPFTTTYASVYNGSWCPRCSKGRGERVCRAILESLVGYGFKRCYPRWIKEAIGRNLQLDGYCAELRLAFEYQGGQHFSWGKGIFHKTKKELEQQQMRDNLKSRACRKQGVKLILIPHWEADRFLTTGNRKEFDALVAYVRESLQSYGITKESLRTVGFKKILNVLHAPQELKKLNEIIRERKIICVSNIYTGADDTHDFKCLKCNYEWKARPTIVKRRTGCPRCAANRRALSRRKYSTSDLKKFAIKKGGRFMSKEYIGMHQKYKWKCKDGHPWEATWGSVKCSGTWCLKCRPRKYSIEDLQDFAKKKGGVCLSKTYTRSDKKYTWRCKRGHPWSARWGDVRAGKWCRKCYHLSLRKS